MITAERFFSWFWKALAIFLVLNLGRHALSALSHSSDDTAATFVSYVQQHLKGVPKPFSSVKVVKDPGGAGVLVNFTLKPEAVDAEQQLSDTALRQLMARFFGIGNLRYLIDDGAYLVVAFNAPDGHNLRRVIYSPSNFRGYRELPPPEPSH